MREHLTLLQEEHLFSNEHRRAMATPSASSGEHRRRPCQAANPAALPVRLLQRVPSGALQRGDQAVGAVRLSLLAKLRIRSGRLATSTVPQHPAHPRHSPGLRNP